MTIDQYCKKHHLSYAAFSKIVDLSYSYLHANRHTNFRHLKQAINSTTIQQIYDKTRSALGDGLILWELQDKLGETVMDIVNGIEDEDE